MEGVASGQRQASAGCSLRLSGACSVDDRVLGSLWVTRELEAPAPRNSLRVEEGVHAREGTPAAEGSQGIAGVQLPGPWPSLLGAAPGGRTVTLSMLLCFFLVLVLESRII